MTPETAYDYAKRVKAIGLAFFPRELEALTNIGTELTALNETQADTIIRAMSSRSRWDPAEFTRMIASVQSSAKLNTATAAPRDDYQGRITTWLQKVSIGILQQISNDAGRAAATMPPEDPRYQQAQAKLVRTVSEVYGASHPAIAPAHIEHNTRSKLAYLLMETACKEAEAK